MRIDIDVTMEYQLGDPMVFLAIEAAHTDGQIIREEQLDIEGATVNRINGEGGLGQRIWANVPDEHLQLRYRAAVDITRPAIALEDLAATPMHELPGEAVSYLRPSRFCQSDMFIAFVARRFGDYEGGAKVAAIRDWVSEEMTYLAGSSNAATTVLDTFISREGVCRDYAHMVCALVRAANIPARYASVYGAEVTPPDFHAVAQVWLDGGWHLVDATGMCPAESLVVMSIGRDACDVAFMETETPAQLEVLEIAVQQSNAVE